MRGIEAEASHPEAVGSERQRPSARLQQSVGDGPGVLQHRVVAVEPLAIGGQPQLGRAVGRARDIANHG